jgi:Ca2+-binding EF-hand superfamily protein
MDDDGSRSLDRRELADGLKDFGVSMSSASIDELFAFLDKDKSGKISFDEFLQALRVSNSCSSAPKQVHNCAVATASFR